jgi:hypothetical protein
VILKYVTSIFPYELLVISLRKLNINRERLLNFIRQYLQIFSDALDPTIKGWDVFHLNYPI